MIPVNEDLRYALQDEAASEDFDDGSLMFLARQNKVVEINHSARRILRLLNGRRSLKQVIEKTARDFAIQEKVARRDVQKLIADLGDQGAVKPAARVTFRRRKKMDQSASLLANSRISLREEEDGAILFDADTNGLQIVNPTGLLIWKFIQVHPRTRADIVGHLKEVCEGVPTGQVETDVDDFVSELQGKGFIGEVADEKR
jgi:hypothetical protein